MSKRYKLTWQPGSGRRTGRWKKFFKGRAYYFDGGTGKTDRAAYSKALEDWERMRESLEDARTEPLRGEYETAIAEWTAVQNWSMKNDDREHAQLARRKIRELESRLKTRALTPLKHGDRLLDRFELLLPVSLPKEFHDPESPANSSHLIDPRKFGDHFDGTPMRISKELWRDRIESQLSQQDNKQITIGSRAVEFLKKKRSQVDIGELSAGRYSSLVLHLAAFEGFVGSCNEVVEITAETLESYRNNLLRQVKAGDFGRAYARDRFEASRQFARWLWTTRKLHELPRNIDSRELRITVPTSKVIAFSVADVKQLLKETEGQMKLYILLALNTAMTQVDISELRQSAVDWQRGRITRKRTKTDEHENVPTVTYKLWRQTSKLLKKYRETEGERALLNPNGRPLKIEELRENGKVYKVDNIGRAFHRLAQRLELKGANFKRLRKTSPSLMVPKFAGLRTFFLGHAPRELADRNYTDPPDNALDEVIDWLGEQYGVV